MSDNSASGNERIDGSVRGIDPATAVALAAGLTVGLTVVLVILIAAVVLGVAP